MKCCDISAGMLRTGVEFQRSTRTSDGAGGAITTWTAISGAPTRAFFKGLSGTERLMAQRLDAQTTARIMVRYIAGITPNDRVLVEGDVFNIRYVDDIERRKRWLSIDIAGGVAT